MKQLRMTCPSCQNSLQVPEEIRRLNCVHCGTELIVERGEGFAALRPAGPTASPVPAPEPKPKPRPAPQQPRAAVKNRRAVAAAERPPADAPPVKKKRSLLAAGLFITLTVLVICCGLSLLSVLFSNGSGGEETVDVAATSGSQEAEGDQSAASGAAAVDDVQDVEGSPRDPATPVPQPDATSKSLALPLKLVAGDWEFNVENIELHESLSGGTTPEEDVFVVFLGTLVNRAEDRACSHGGDWKLLETPAGTEYSFDYSASDRVKEIYNLNYPGAFLGLCVSGKHQLRTFLVFDVPQSPKLALVHRGNQGDQTIELDTVQQLAGLPTATVPPTPTLTPTPTNTPVPTSTPTPSSAAMAVALQNGNLRAGPGTEFEVVGGVGAGDEIAVYGRNEAGTWLRVSWQDQVWISAILVDVTEEIASIAIEPTATPTPTQTPVPTPSSTPLPLNAGASDWMEYDGLRVGVREIAWSYSLGYFQPETGKIYLSLYILAYNGSDLEETFSRTDFSVVDGGGERSGNVIFGDRSPEFFSCTIRPGGLCEGWWTTMIWDRPEVKRDLVLSWSPGFFSARQETPIWQE